MKKQLFALLYMILTGFACLWANPVSETEALQLAIQFRQQRHTSGLRSAEVFTLVPLQTTTGLRSAEVHPPYYIYNIGDNQGFVIVSGDDAAKPILGYADEGSFQTMDMPVNLSAWLDFYRKEIEALQAASATGSSNVASWSAGTTVVAPLLGSIKWNQTAPFNQSCPLDAATNSRTLAGCVAVAMAQIMRYHGWPLTGTGTHSYTDPKYGIQSVDLSKTTYDWSNMLGTYTSTATEAQKAAVAALIYQCGVTVNMQYGINSSSSNMTYAAEAFVSHFGYDAEIQRYEREYYSDSEWKALIRKELDNARPIYYSASSDEGGHAFVCDGYDSNGFFHINWGWGGSSNGYFELSSLSTANPGQVGATPEFCYNQSILAGIHQADAINKVSNQIVIYNTGLTSNKTSVSNISSSTSSNTFTLSFNFWNVGLSSVNARWGIGYIKDGTSTLTKVAENSTTYSALNLGYYYSASFNISNPTGMSSAGTYRMYPIYQPKDSTSWSIVRGSNVLNNCMVVTVSSSKSATIKPLLAAPALVLTAEPAPGSRLYQNKTIHVDLSIQNQGQDFFSKVGLCLISVTNSADRTYLCESTVGCPAGKTMTFHLMDSVKCKPGKYYLQALFDSTNSNAIVKYKVFGPSNLNAKVVDVLPTPGEASLQLNNPIALSNGVVFKSADTVQLSANLKNTGGYFDSRIIAFVFTKGGGGQSLTYLAPQNTYIDSLETRQVTLTGNVELAPGDYVFYLYSYQNSDWKFLSPNSLAKLDFSITDGNVPIHETAELTDGSIHLDGTCLQIDVNKPIKQSMIFDMSGKLLMQAGSERSIQVGSLAAGVYQLYFQTNDKGYRQTFLKR